MLYKDRANTFETAKAFLHFIISLIICLIASVLLIRYQFQIHEVLSEKQIMAINGLLNILTMIAIFIIFNTSYYAYASYQRIKMLIFAIVFLCLGVLKILASVAATHLSLGIQVGASIVSEYEALGDLVFVIGILISAFVAFDSKVRNPRNVFIKYWPIIGIVVLVITLGLFNKLLSIFGREWVVYAFNRLYLVMLVTALILNFVLFVRNNNGYLVRVCSGLLCIVAGRLVLMSGGEYIEIITLASHMFNLAGFYIIFTAVFRFNVGLPLQDLKNAEKQIKLYANNLERIIDKRTEEVRKSNEKFIHELDYAKSIQQSLLPTKKPNYKDIQFVSEYFPCERLSGDFYDIYRIDAKHIGMYVLDVSGHGISAALMTMFCNNVIKSSEKLIQRYRGLKPHRNLMHFYEEFNKMNFPDEMHMVIFYASYNLEEGILTYCSGGMNCQPIVMKEDGEIIYLDKSKGFPICKMGDYYTPEYVSATIKLSKNDLVIFYTDGLVDKDKNKCLNEMDFENLLRKNSGASLQTINGKIAESINANLHHIDDDITYFIMKVTKGEKNEGLIDSQRS